MQNSIDYFGNKNLFNIPKDEKEAIFLSLQKKLCSQHYEEIPTYKNIMDGLGLNNIDTIQNLASIPFLPASLFKKIDFCPNNILLQLYSSGTRGEKSMIKLSISDINIQKKALYKVTQSFINLTRRPMIVFSSIESGNKLSAKSAGNLGFMLFAQGMKQITDKNNSINELLSFVEMYGDNILIYGTTTDIYEKLLEGINCFVADLKNAIVIMGGGWKNSSKKVTWDEFTSRFNKYFNIQNIFDYYAMSEQMGSIFFRCEYGHYHCSAYSDVIIRDPLTFKPNEIGKIGLIQVLSCLPIEYPTNSVLTEDLGILLGEDDCPCKRTGKYFQVIGRLPKVSEKGCSYE